MARKASKGINSSTAGYCNSKRSVSRPVRVVEISNPRLIKTSASEFRAVVQSLTGRKRSTATGIQYEEINLYSENEYCPQLKVPMLEDRFQKLNDTKAPEPAIIDDNCCSDERDGDIRIFEDLEGLPIQIPRYMLSQHLVFDSMESLGDPAHIAFDIVSPSIILSGFE